jgi:RNA recognition motif-containing protein
MKLFIAKLNREANEENLTEHFSQFGGVVSVKVVTDRDTGQSKCFGFIEMDSAESGTAAINEQNGEEYLGFRMVVKEAEDKPRTPRPSPSDNSRGDSSNRGSRDDKGGADRQSGSISDSSPKKNFSSPPSSSKSNNKKPSKRGKGSSDKFADGPKKTIFEKRPKSNRNQWLDDLDDF